MRFCSDPFFYFKRFFLVGGALAAISADIAAKAPPTNEGLKSKNFAGALDAYLEGDYPATGEGQGRVKYVDDSEEYGASFLGIGIDHLVITSPMHKWMSWIMEMVNQRDRDGKLKKVYFEGPRVGSRIVGYYSRPDLCHSALREWILAVRD